MLQVIYKIQNEDTWLPSLVLKQRSETSKTKQNNRHKTSVNIFSISFSIHFLFPRIQGGVNAMWKILIANLLSEAWTFLLKCYVY